MKTNSYMNIGANDSASQVAARIIEAQNHLEEEADKISSLDQNQSLL